MANVVVTLGGLVMVLIGVAIRFTRRSIATVFRRSYFSSDMQRRVDSARVEDFVNLIALFAVALGLGFVAYGL